MIIRVSCPHCHQEYKIPEQKIGSRADCKKCGKPFLMSADDDPGYELEPPVAKSPTQEARQRPIALAPRSAKQFKALEAIATIYVWAAWFVLILSVLIAVVFAVVAFDVIAGYKAGETDAVQTGYFLGLMCGILLASFWSALLMKGIGEGIRLFLQIEINTRK